MGWTEFLHGEYATLENRRQQIHAIPLVRCDFTIQKLHPIPILIFQSHIFHDVAFFYSRGTSPPTRLFFCCRYVPRNVPTTEKYAATPFCGGFPRNAPKAFIRTTIHIICKMASPQKPRFALQSHDWFSVTGKCLAYRSFAQFQFLIFDIHNGYFQKKVIQISQIFQIRQEKTA